MADEWNFEVIREPQCPPGMAYIVPKGMAVPTQTYGCGCPIVPHLDEVKMLGEDVTRADNAHLATFTTLRRCSGINSPGELK